MTIWQLAMAALAGLMFHASPAPAQNFPDKPITIVIPLGAGGAMDRITRLIGEQMSKRLGQPVVVENRPGAGMVVGAQAVANAAPDGYTLMNAPSGAYSINPTLFKSLPYDPDKDFVPVAMYTNIPFVLVVNPALPINSVQELIKFAKDNPGKLTYAASTRGGAIHLAGEMFRHDAKINMTSVPYKQGGPAALNDVVAGHVMFTFADPSIVQGLIEGGKVRALGVTSRQRMPNLPNIPTIDEAGVKGYEAVSWHMIVAPSKTPRPIVDKLNAEIRTVTAAPEMRDQMLKMGLMPVENAPVAELQKFMASESKRWGDIVRESGVAGSM